MLWILLALSAVFLGGVQIYVRQAGSVAPVTVDAVSEEAILDAFSPVEPVRATDLSLSWKRVSGAVQYQIRIHTLQGTPVVDPMGVWGEQWRPSEELLPGLTPGAYRWTVEGVDAAGQVLARSLPMELEIR